MVSVEIDTWMEFDSLDELQLFLDGLEIETLFQVMKSSIKQSTTLKKAIVYEADFGSCTVKLATQVKGARKRSR